MMRSKHGTLLTPSLRPKSVVLFVGVLFVVYQAGPLVEWTRWPWWRVDFANAPVLIVYPHFAGNLVADLLHVVGNSSRSAAASLASASRLEELSSCQKPGIEGKRSRGHPTRLLIILPDPVELVQAYFAEETRRRAARSSGNAKTATPAKHYLLRDFAADQTADYEKLCERNLTAGSDPSLKKRRRATACCKLTGAQRGYALVEGLYEEHIDRWKSAFERINLDILLIYYENVLGNKRRTAKRLSTFFGGTVTTTIHIERKLKQLAEKYSRKSPLLQAEINREVSLSKDDIDMQTHARLTGFFEKHHSSPSSVRDKLQRIAMKPEEWRGCLLAAARKYSINNTLVVLFCEKTYLNILVNWLAFFRLRAASHAPYLLVTSDKHFQEFLADKGVNSVHLSAIASSNLASSFWKTRIRVFLWLSKWNFTVIHSDVDAIWLQDPIREILGHLGRGKDQGRLLVSRDIFPGEQQREWGSALCTGFMAFRGGRRTGALRIAQFGFFENLISYLSHV